MKKLLMRSKGAFTMAEILISLTIIGVIAAITLPALKGNINEKTWATQKKALYARMSQAISLMDSLNSYSGAQAFITEGLSNVLKINNICARDALADCGLPTQVINMSGVPLADGFPNTWSALGINQVWTNAATTNNMVAAFETQNGESVVLYYNPDCIPDNDDAPTDNNVNLFRYTCVNMIFDLNAEKGPNTMGKDIGYMTAFYATDPVVTSSVPGARNGNLCSNDERVPNMLEAASMQINWNIIGDTAMSLVTSSRGIDTAGAPHYYNVAAVADGDNDVTTLNRTQVTEAPANDALKRCVRR